jgi:hypothetical protein
MKKILKIVLAMTALLPIFSKTANAEKREGVEVTKTAAAVNFTQSIDVSPYDRFSAQATYSDGTPATFISTMGARASATITIGNNPSGLIGTQASVTVNIVSTPTVVGDAVTIAGTVFTEGVDWSAVGVSSATAATNLKNKIDAHPSFVATVSGATVTIKYVSYGSAGNGLPITSSDATNLKLSASTLTGGINRDTIMINGVVLTEGVDFNANSSSQTTAINISTSINANTTLNTQVSASTSALGVVTVVALYPGYSNYSLGSSTAGFLTSSGFPGGLTSDVDPSTDIFTKINHGLTTGLKVFLSTTAGSVPTGLSFGTTYYAIKLNENQYSLATTSTTAVAGTKIDITGVTDNSIIRVNPIALSAAAGNGFFWQASNNNVDFSTLSTVTYSSVTYSSASNSIWDFAEFGYKYLRVNFTGPTNGGIALSIKLYGRKD